MEKGLLETTGKPLEHWIKVVTGTSLSKHSEIVNYLKSEHGFTHGFANFVSLKARASDAASASPEKLLHNQYSGGKEHLRIIYDHLISRVLELGDDIEIVPKKANVSIRRKRQFLLVQPSTKTRMDLGLKLNDAKFTGRLLDSGIFGAMCSHRIVLNSQSGIDNELFSYIKQAYSEAG